MGDTSYVIRSLSLAFCVLKQKKTKMEVKIVFAKSAIVRAQLGRVCFAHPPADLYPVSFGIKGTCSNIFRIISSGKSWRTFGGLV